MIVNTSQAMPTTIQAGIAIRKPMPRVMNTSTHSAKKTIATVMLKFSASLA